MNSSPRATALPCDGRVVSEGLRCRRSEGDAQADHRRRCRLVRRDRLRRHFASGSRRASRRSERVRSTGPLQRKAGGSVTIIAEASPLSETVLRVLADTFPIGAGQRNHADVLIPRCIFRTNSRVANKLRRSLAQVSGAGSTATSNEKMAPSRAVDRGFRQCRR